MLLTLIDMSKLKGCKVHLTTEEGKYEGIVKFISSGTQEVTLEKACMLPSRDSLFGSVNFFIFEIISCEVVKTSVSSNKILRENDVKAVDQSKDKMSVRAEGISDEISDPSKDDFEEKIIYDEEDGNIDPNSIPKQKEYALELPHRLKKVLPQDFCIVDDMAADFHEAVTHIKKQSNIGVAFEGDSIGRYGQLCWIGISTKACTFLFDICALKEKAFEKGLKAVFEDSNIMKVIHDCRQASDSLYHQYNTSLVNIFDTQVADVFIKLQNCRNGKVQSNVRTLAYCLNHYLDLSDEEVYSDEMLHQLPSEKNFQWTLRPANNLMKDTVIKDALFLRELKIVQVEFMLSSYMKAVEVYLGVLRNASEEELDLTPSEPSVLPQALLINGLKVINCKELSSDRATVEERYNQLVNSNGFCNLKLKDHKPATLEERKCQTKLEERKHQPKRSNLSTLHRQKNVQLNENNCHQESKASKEMRKNQSTHSSKQSSSNIFLARSTQLTPSEQLGQSSSDSNESSSVDSAPTDFALGVHQWINESSSVDQCYHSSKQAPANLFQKHSGKLTPSGRLVQSTSDSNGYFTADSSPCHQQFSKSSSVNQRTHSSKQSSSNIFQKRSRRLVLSSSESSESSAYSAPECLTHSLRRVEQFSSSESVMSSYSKIKFIPAGMVI